jgi:hypothetical protein
MYQNATVAFFSALQDVEACRLSSYGWDPLTLQEWEPFCPPP